MHSLPRFVEINTIWNKYGIKPPPRLQVFLRDFYVELFTFFKELARIFVTAENSMHFLLYSCDPTTNYAIRNTPSPWRDVESYLEAI